MSNHQPVVWYIFITCTIKFLLKYAVLALCSWNLVWWLNLSLRTVHGGGSKWCRLLFARRPCLWKKQPYNAVYLKMAIYVENPVTWNESTQYRACGNWCWLRDVLVTFCPCWFCKTGSLLSEVSQSSEQNLSGFAYGACIGLELATGNRRTC